MADDCRPLPGSSGDLPRRVPGSNWLVPGQPGVATKPAERLPVPAPVTPSELALSQPPAGQADGKLPKRVPGSSAFQAAPGLAPRRPLPVLLEDRPAEVATMPPPVLAAARPAAQPPSPQAEPQRTPARARARRWWLAGLLAVVGLAIVAVLTVILHH